MSISLGLTAQIKSKSEKSSQHVKGKDNETKETTKMSLIKRNTQGAGKINRMESNNGKIMTLMKPLVTDCSKIKEEYKSFIFRVLQNAGSDNINVKKIAPQASVLFNGLVTPTLIFGMHKDRADFGTYRISDVIDHGLYGGLILEGFTMWNPKDKGQMFTLSYEKGDYSTIKEVVNISQRGFIQTALIRMANNSTLKVKIIPGYQLLNCQL